MHIGPFQLEELLGKGGMGEVWQGFHKEQQLPVAVKVILRQGATQRAYIEAFKNEVQAMATLDHPGIIAVLDYGLIDARAAKASGDWLVQGTPYLVMEKADRGSLDKWMYRLQWPDIKSILFMILDALAHAHANGVIHRDLKPQNLLLGFNQTSAVKLTDFGLAHAVNDDERDGRFESVWGTPAYMAPEQIKGLWREYGPWTDLYALGCMAYELVAGKPPFWGENPSTCWKGHLHSDVPRWKPRLGVPPKLESWVLRLLQKEPHARFQHAADAAIALALICEEEGSIDFVTEGSGELALHFLSDSSQQTAPQIALGNTAIDGNITTHGSTQHSTKLNTLDWESFAEQLSDLSEISEAIDAEASQIEPFPSIKPPFPSTWKKQHGTLPRYRLHGTGLHLHKLKTLRLVDRLEQRDRLWEAFKATYVTSEPHVVLLSGPAGVGKSRLAQWLSTRAHEQGAANTLHGTFGQNESVYDGLLPMVARYINCIGLDYKSTQLRIAKFLKRYNVNDSAHFRPLAHVFLEHDEDYMASPAAEQQTIYTKQQRYDVLLENLQHISHDRTTIVVMEDVQWGAEALMFVHHALRHHPHLPILFVMTYRDAEVESGSLEAEILKDLKTHHNTQAIELPPLETADFSELVQHMIPLTPKLTRQVELRAHGIPSFAIQLVSSWIDQQRLEPHPEGFTLKQGDDALPDDIHDLMQRQLDKLPEEHRTPLSIAAALGLHIREKEWQHTAMLMGLYDVTLVIDYLQQADIIQMVDEQTWRFAHNMLRESLTRDAREKDIWPTINAACAQTLVDLYPKLGPHQERRAFHLLEAGMQTQALEALRLAAVRRRSRSELLRTHRLLDRHDAIAAKLALPDHDAERLQAALLRAGTFDMQGRYREAKRWAKQAHELALLYGPPALMLSGSLHRAWATLHLGETEQAETWFNQALSLTDDPMTARACHIGLARVYQRRGQLRRAHETFHDALRQAQRGQHREHIATCLNGLGDIARQRNALEEARDYSEQSLELSKRMSHRFLLGDCYTDLAELYRYERNHSRATLMASKALTIFSAIESNMSHRVRIQLAIIALEQGEYEGAYNDLTPVVQALESLDDKGQLPIALMAQCVWLAASTQWTQMRDILERVDEYLIISQRRHRDLVHLAQQAMEATINAMPEDIHFSLQNILSNRQPSLDD